MSRSSRSAGTIEGEERIRYSDTTTAERRPRLAGVRGLRPGPLRQLWSVSEQATTQIFAAFVVPVVADENAAPIVRNVAAHAAGAVFRRRLRPLIWHLLFAAALYAMGDADFVRYLHQAHKCLDQAEKATREVDKEAWLQLAKEWMEMARKALRRKLN